MRKVIDRLEGIDIDNLQNKVEDEAVRFENAFLDLFKDEQENESKAPRIP